MAPHLLIVDDDRMVRESLADALERPDLRVSTAEDGQEALSLLAADPSELVLTDVRMPGMDGVELLRRIRERAPAVEVILMTAHDDMPSVVAAMREGAREFLVKPLDLGELRALVDRTLAEVRARPAGRSAPARGPSPAEDPKTYRLDRLVGRDPGMIEVFKVVGQATANRVNVLIRGESGTGKELIAQFIHRHSRRASRKLVPVNCAALPEPLLESEMFGHKKGAFTGADRDKPGLLEVANGGTFFLDELTEMSQPLQAKLLRVIQDGVVRRVGSENQDAVVDVRFISATNRDPQEAVKQSILREDLFYRLRVVPIQLPPLRKRLEDIPLLANHFLAYYWERHRQTGELAPKLTEAAVDFLRAKPWRGNVRELQNVIEHVAVLAEPNQPIEPSDIPIYDEPTGEIASDGSMPTGILNDAYHPAKDRLIAHFEKEYLSRLVSRAGGNMSKAARLASIDRTTLYRLMEKHNFQRNELTGFGE
jgi:DNA-binding NtrC family response regulator